MTETDRPYGPSSGDSREEGSAPERGVSEPAPSPFDPPPDRRFERDRAQERPSAGPGVTKPLLIGCGVLLFLLLVAGVLFVVNASSVMAWMLGFLEEQIEPMLPEDLPQATRARYDGAWHDAIAAVREGRFDPAAVQAAQREIMALTRGAKEVEGGVPRLTEEQVERLTAALERVPASGEGAGADGDAAGEGAAQGPAAAAAAA